MTFIWFVIDPKIPLSLPLSPKGRGNSFNQIPSLEGRGLRGG